MSDAQNTDLTYEGGFDAVVARMEARRDPLSFAPGETLPPITADLQALKDQTIEIPAKLPRAKDRSEHLRKWLDLAEEFKGQSALLHLHGLLIAHLRKRTQPDHTMALFTRIWAEEHAFLLEQLDPRWLVSAITTFGDHGNTEPQRRVGQSMTVLMNTMKLYESERLYSGLRPEQEFKLKRLVDSKLPLNMDRYALVAGGLDVNMLGRLWEDAREDAILKPLAHRLLTLLNHDPGTVFRRLATLRGRKLRQRQNRADESAASLPAAPKRPDWSVVTTAKGRAEDALAFARHHLALGAANITLYLDAPLTGDRSAHAALHSLAPRLALVSCDTAYWQAQNRPRPNKHQQRQMRNATQAYAQAQSDWLAHIDLDEFIHAPRPVAEALDAASEGTDAIVMPPAEEIARPEDAPEDAPRLFRRTYFDAGCPKSVLYEAYPTFGRYLRSGFISHTIGKTIARTGLSGDIRFGLHQLKRDDTDVPTLRSARLTLLHAHAPNYESFAEHLAYRLLHGSYRTRDAEQMGLGDILDALEEEHGPAGARRLYDEVCQARPEVIALLDTHGMLIRASLHKALQSEIA